MQAMQWPDTLIYLSTTPIKKIKKRSLHKKLKKAFLLGEFINSQENIFFVNSEIIQKTKFLIIYSKIFSKVIEEIKFSL